MAVTLGAKKVRVALTRVGGLVQKPEVVFLVLATFFGIFSATLVPQLSVSDENMHFLRAYNVASGHLGTQKCDFPSDVHDRAEAVYQGYYQSDYSKKIDFSKIDRAVSCGSAASYSPFMHLPQAIGMLFGKLFYASTGVLVLLGRLGNLAFYVISIYFIIRFVRIGKWAFVVVALFPEMVHLAASLSSDTVNNVVVLAMVALLLNLFTQVAKLTSSQMLLLVLSAAALALTKLTNLILFLRILFLPANLFVPNNTKRLPLNVRKWGVIAASGVTGLVCMLVWQKIYGGPLVSHAPYNPLIHHPLHFVKVLFHTYVDPVIGYDDIVLRGTVGEFSSFKYHSPVFMVMLNFILFMLVMLRSNKSEERLVSGVLTRLSLSTLASTVIMVLAISYALYTSWAIQPYRLGPGALYADGVQGRYFTAAFVLLIPSFVWLRKFISVTIGSEKTLGLLVVSLSGFSLLFYVLETLYVYR